MRLRACVCCRDLGLEWKRHVRDSSTCVPCRKNDKSHARQNHAMCLLRHCRRRVRQLGHPDQLQWNRHLGRGGVVLRRACRATCASTTTTTRRRSRHPCRGQGTSNQHHARCQNVLFWVGPINALRTETRLSVFAAPSGTHGRRGQEARPGC